MKNIIYISAIFVSINIFSQSFAPQAGFEGTTAIHKDSIVFVDWAVEITLNKGFQDIANQGLGTVNFGIPENALNKADGNPNIISLGDGGTAVLQFNFPLVNGNGADFAVFENGFLQDENSPLAFLELAFVEVSTNGIEFIRFPAISEIQTGTQTGSFDFIDARYIYNFAGKYINNYGTPFDLEDLTDLAINTSVDLNNINFIKIIDVTGTINPDYATYDAQGNIVNDPYPTAFASGGFDLDAVGIINNTQNIPGRIELYPNPAQNVIHIRQSIEPVKVIKIFTINGKLVLIKNNPDLLNVSLLKNGVYFVEIITAENIYRDKIIKIN